MDHMIAVPLGFVDSDRFPAICAMTGKTENLTRFPVPVYYRPSQPRQADMPAEVRLYLAADALPAFQSASHIKWWPILLLLIGLLGFVLLAMAQRALAMLGWSIGAFTLFFISILIQGGAWRKLPKVWASHVAGQVELEFPPAAAAAWQACRPALAVWQEAERYRLAAAEAEARRQQVEAEKRLQFTDQPAAAWGSEEPIAEADAVDDWDAAGEPGWDEGDGQK